MVQTADDKNFLYKRLSQEFEERILKGDLIAGEKLPSLRSLHQKLGLSIGTVYQAYVDLEAAGLVEARPKSGFYVSGSRVGRSLPRYTRKPTRPGPVTMTGITKEVMDASLDPDLIPLGASTLSPELFPHKHLGRIIKSFSMDNIQSSLKYSHPLGNPLLRRLLANRMVGLIPAITDQDLIVTNGCMEGVALALQIVTRPGDMVAVESPTHFAFLQLLREMGLHAIAVPTDPGKGIDPDILTRVLDRHPVKTCLTIPNFHNPLGTLMSEERKKEVVRITNDRGVPVIEDDIYGEMYFGKSRPSLLKSYDRADLVFTCSSLSKALAPGFRIGWCAPPQRYLGALGRLKAAFSTASPTLPQEVLVEFMSGGSMDRYLRSLRAKLKRQVTETAQGIGRHFPAGTRFSLPQGGNILWIELPDRIDGIELYHRALAAGVSIVPGRAFSLSDDFENYIRISATSPYGRRIEEGLSIVGGLIDRLAG